MKHLIEVETDSGPNGDRKSELEALKARLPVQLYQILGPEGWTGPRVVSVREMHELGY